MSRRFTRMLVAFSKEEFDTLQDYADREYRHPADQARYFLRQALGLGDTAPQAGDSAKQAPGEKYTGIMVPLGKDEFAALKDAAAREHRQPREQARYLLRQAMGL